MMKRKQFHKTDKMMKWKRSYSTLKPDILPFVVLALVIGSFALAWIDEDARATFADLAKVGVGGYIGLMMPSNRADKPN